METVLSVFFLFLFIVIIISLTCFTIKYIFDGFGLMEMAKTKNEKYPWLAWIPWAKEFLRGKLAYDTDHGKKKPQKNICYPGKETKQNFRGR